MSGWRLSLLVHRCAASRAIAGDLVVRRRFGFSATSHSPEIASIAVTVYSPSQTTAPFWRVRS